MPKRDSIEANNGAIQLVRILMEAIDRTIETVPKSLQAPIRMAVAESVLKIEPCEDAKKLIVAIHQKYTKEE